MLDRDVWIIGTGGHAQSLASLLRARNDEAKFITPQFVEPSNKIPHVNEEKFLEENNLDRILVNGLGVRKEISLRQSVIHKYLSLGYEFLPVMADSAIISENSLIGSGVQLFHNSFVGNHSTLQDHVALGTGSIVEHDSKIGTGAFVGPGVTICGEVELGDWSFIGAGTVITPGTVVPAGMFVKAGSLITPKTDYR